MPPSAGAARVLLESDSAQDHAALIGLLMAKTTDPSTAQAVAQAIVDSPSPPPLSLASPLLGLLQRADDPLQTVVALALVRFNDPAVRRQITALARDPQAPFKARRGAMLAVSQQPTQQAAGLLIDLLDSAQPPAIRATAMADLAQLTGMTEPGSDPAAWKKWWSQAAASSPEEWQTRLRANFAHRQSQSDAVITQLQSRLVETQVRLYQATAADKQPEMLAVMLADSLNLMRRTAMEQVNNRLRFQGGVSITPELHQALRTRLDDSDDSIVHDAVSLLRDLGDELTADRVARELAEGRQQQPEILQAYLQVMTRMPRAQPVPRIIALLSDKALAGDAAAALAAAADAKEPLISPAQLQALAPALRSLIPADGLPDARLVSLLAHVAGPDDWKLMEKWLDAVDRLVKAAAAAAWVRSDRPLSVLAQRRRPRHPPQTSRSRRGARPGRRHLRPDRRPQTPG